VRKLANKPLLKKSCAFVLNIDKGSRKISVRLEILLIIEDQL